MSFDSLTANNLMAHSMRKRLTRRQGSEELRAHMTDDEDSSDSSRSENGITSRARSHAPADLNSTPPAPTHYTIRRVSPPSSVLDRYKSRAPAAVAPSVSPGADHKTGRNSSFSEIFDSSITPIATPPATHPGTPLRETPDPILVRGGLHYLMTRPKDCMENKRSSAEVLPTVEAMASPSIAETPRKRLTRAQSRRDKRADSVSTDVEQEMVDAKDFATVRKVSDDGVTSRKNSSAKASRTPSPDQKKNLNFGTSAPTNSPRNPATEHLTSFCKNGTSTTDDYPSPDAISQDPLAASSDISHITDSPSPAPAKTCIQDFKSASGAVTVNPPRYDPTRIALHQWCSSLGSNSRPESAWGWMKKWTCCRCRALTMVEQRDCARLECGHQRCHGSCKVIRGGTTKEDRESFA